MTQPELEKLLITTLAAADPNANAKTMAEFKLGWAQYAEAHHEEGDKPFLDAAVACGFRRVLSARSGYGYRDPHEGHQPIPF